MRDSSLRLLVMLCMKNRTQIVHMMVVFSDASTEHQWPEEQEEEEENDAVIVEEGEHSASM